MLIDRLPSMSDDILLKFVHREEKLVKRGKRSKKLNDVKPVENINKKSSTDKSSVKASPSFT